MRALLILAACSGPVAPAAAPLGLGYASPAPPDEAAFARALAQRDVAALEQLLAIDLPAFEPRARGVVPDDKLAALDAAWARAIERGAPMLMFVGAHGDQQILTAAVMRVGAWVDQRFVPIGPPVQDAVGGWYDAAHARAITVGLQVDDCKSDFCPRLTHVRVEAWSPTGQPLGRFAQDVSEVHTVFVESGATLRVQLDDCNLAGCRTPWQRIDHGPPQPAANQVELVVDHRGSYLVEPAVTDGADKLVVKTEDRCDCENEPAYLLTHAIDRWDARGGMHVVSHGKGQAAAVVGKDGVYVQIGNDTVERFASLAEVGRASGAALPKGFLLLPPAGARSCCGL